MLKRSEAPSKPSGLVGEDVTHKTPCTELPVFINTDEVDLDINEPITGHIDTNKALLCE